MTTTTLFTTLTFADPRRAMAFLEAVGFTRRAVYTDPTDDDVIVHAQYAWGDRGGIMFGSPRDERSQPGQGDFEDRVGVGSCYCVVATDEDVDDRHAVALAAGATSVQEPMSPDYGGRTCTVRDAEGNQWTFGSYPGE
ncbi:MAG: bleomycin resistance protein [Thermoleophilia bacterium]|nr:bleomycin resistance protein [Thermoleophilia bacterium]